MRRHAALRSRATRSRRGRNVAQHAEPPLFPAGWRARRERRLEILTASPSPPTATSGAGVVEGMASWATATSRPSGCPRRSRPSLASASSPCRLEECTALPSPQTTVFGAGFGEAMAGWATATCSASCCRSRSRPLLASMSSPHRLERPTTSPSPPTAPSGAGVVEPLACWATATSSPSCCRRRSRHWSGGASSPCRQGTTTASPSPPTELWRGQWRLGPAGPRRPGVADSAQSWLAAMARPGRLALLQRTLRPLMLRRMKETTDADGERILSLPLHSSGCEETLCGDAVHSPRREQASSPSRCRGGCG